MHNSMSRIVDDAGSPIHRVISVAASESNNNQNNFSFTTKVTIIFSMSLFNIVMEPIWW